MFVDFFHRGAFDYWLKFISLFHAILPFDGLWIVSWNFVCLMVIIMIIFFLIVVVVFICVFICCCHCLSVHLFGMGTFFFD